jgi:flagellar motor protein MotB
MSILAALAAASLLGAAGCAEMQNLRANSEAQTKRIEELQKAQSKTAAAHADELRRMQADVDKAKAERDQAKSGLVKTQTLKSERELDLERTYQETSKALQEKAAKVELLSKELDQRITGADALQKKSDDLQEKVKDKGDAQAKAEADVKSLTEKLADAKKSGDETADLKKKLADAQKSADKSGGENDPDLEEAYTFLKTSMKPLVDADLAFVTRDSRGVVVGLKSDYVFEQGSTVVSDQSHPTLDRIAEIYAKSKKYVEVQGHTDAQPVINQPFVDNWALASARADNVVRYLADQTKVMSSHLKSTSCSEYRDPDAKTGGGQTLKRRVELILSSRP